MEILVDTSVWIGHFRESNPDLDVLIASDRVACHSVVLGGLAVGGLRDRQETLDDLLALPSVIEVRTRYALDFLDRHRLYNIGLSWGDVQILAAAVLNAMPIWSLDARLAQQAAAFNLAWTP